MGVQFVLGRSGTGKTRYCIDAICAELDRSEGDPLLLLVPEQASFQAERAVLAHPEIEGFDRLSILSFDRLQYQLLGKHASKTRLSALGRQMVVHQIILDHLDRLEVFRASASSPGFVRQMTLTLEELQRSARTPEEIDGFLRQTRAPAGGPAYLDKFADIRLIYEAYLARIEGRFIDPHRQLWDARAAVAGSPLLRGARLWVDGFSGFTISEILLLRELLAAARETTLALCLDPEEIERDSEAESEKDTSNDAPFDLFAPTRETYTDLCRIVAELKLARRETLVLKSARRFSASPPLAHVESALFRSDAQRCPSEGRIHLIGAANERAECQFVAGQIRALVQGGALRYRDIAVVVSDLGRYEHYVHAYFSDKRIPFFIDKQRSMDQHPCATLIRSALNVVTDGFDTFEVLTYLRSGLLGVASRDVDRLENYCSAFGIGARDWLAESDWSFAGPEHGGFADGAIDTLRRRICRPLTRLGEALHTTGTSDRTVSARRFVEALFDFLNRLHISDAIGALVSASQARGDLALADRHHQFYDATLAVVEELLVVFGEQRHPAAFFSLILLDAFQQMTLAQIPPSMDQVLVGSIERSRHPDVRVVFLVGTTQRQFPAPLKGSGVLTDHDRDRAEAGGLSLVGGSLHLLSQRRYLAYIAFTRASEQLFVTYPLSDEKGRAGLRSQFVDDLAVLFSDLDETYTEGEALGQPALQSLGEIQEHLCRAIQRPRAVEGILDVLGRDPRFAGLYGVVARAATLGDEATLASTTVEQLFGGDLHTSATRLSVYAACPYQYFAKYMLALKPREAFVLEPIDIGNFYHRVLELWVREMVEQRVDWDEITREALGERIDAAIESVLREDRFWGNFVRSSRTNAFLVTSAQEVLKAASQDLTEMIRAGRFRPVQAEADFGADDSDLGPYELELSPTRTLRLHGKVDRIDCCAIGGQETAIVFDYKRREKTVNWSSLYHGLDMQLVVYLNALRRSGKWGRTAGAFFVPLEVSAKVGRLGDLFKPGDAFPRKARGLFAGDIAAYLDGTAQKDSRYYNFYVTADGEPYGSYFQRGVLRTSDFDLVRASVEAKIRELATGLNAGRIGVHPVRHGNQTPCSHCDYRPVCRFDWQVHEPVFLNTRSKSEVLETMAEATPHE